VPHEIMEVDPAVIEDFLGRVKDPLQVEPSGEVPIDKAFRTIMFTDLKDSTLMTTTYGDSKALHLLHIHNLLIRDALRNYDGSEVKHTGDGFMVSFASAMNAVDCAAAIQQALSLHNEETQEESLFVRIGLSAGEPIEEDGDLFGSAVQLAARLCAHAEPTQILAAQVVLEQCPGSESRFSDLGQINAKGFDEAIRVYQVEWQS
jgi:class 3 adenylate cyclase